jgi:hypothetical protein
LADYGRRAIGFHGEFEPSPSGHLHLSYEPQPPVWFVRFHAPEIKRAPGQRLFGIGSAPRDTDAASQQI